MKIAAVWSGSTLLRPTYLNIKHKYFIPVTLYLLYYIIIIFRKHEKKKKKKKKNS